MVGHATTVSAPPVLVDLTAPSRGQVTVQSLTSDAGCLSTSVLHVRWEAVTDLESGVALQEVSVGLPSSRHANDVNTVTPFSVTRGNSVTLNVSGQLVDGHAYVILLKVCFV